MSVLYLDLRQFCKIAYTATTKDVKIEGISSMGQSSNMTDFNTYLGHSPDKWINSINKVFESLWKISSYWVDNLMELLAKPFDRQVINILARD